MGGLMKQEGSFLTAIEELILLALLQSTEGAYGMVLQEVIQKETEQLIALGVVYATLDRLARKGLVDSWKGPASKVRGGRGKVFYQVNAAGFQRLMKIREVRERMFTSGALNLARIKCSKINGNKAVNQKNG